MKKLCKLQINSEKIMKNEELLILRGGYNGFDCWVGQPGGITIDEHFIFSSTNGLIEATQECSQFYRQYFPGAYCVCD